MFMGKETLKKTKLACPKGSIDPTGAVYLKYIGLLGIILAIALALRLYDLDKYSLWYDESIVVLDEWGLDKLPPLANLYDSNFVLKNHDYLTLYSHGLVYYWQRLFGSSEYALRLSSVIFSLLSIYFLFILGKEFFNIKISQLASLLLVISPFHIHYSQELRPYAAVCLLTLVSAYSFLKIIKTGLKKYWFIYIITNVLNIYFLCVNFIVLLAFCSFFILKIKRYRHLLGSFLIAHIVILFLLLPVFLSLYPNLRYFFNSKMDARWCEFPIWAGERIGIRNLLFTFKNFSIGYNVDCYSFVGIFTTSIYFFLFLFWAFKSYKKIDVQLLLYGLFGPILLLFFISRVKTCYVDRYFFVLFSFYILGVAAGLNEIKNRFFRLFVIILIIFLNSFGLKNYYLNYLPADYSQHVGVNKKNNIKGMAEVISDNYRRGDRILHTCKNTVFPLKFYIRGVCHNPELIQAIEQGRVIFYSPGKEDLLTVDFVEPHPILLLPEDYKVVKDLEKISRLWLLFSSWDFRGVDSEEYKVVKTIRENFKESKFKKFDGAYLYLFTRNRT